MKYRHLLKTSIGVFLCLFVITLSAQEKKLYPYATVTPIGFEHVEITPGFIKTLRDRVRDVSLADYMKGFEKDGLIENFRIISEKRTGENGEKYGGRNEDEFIHKELEALSLLCNESPEVAKLQKYLAETILAAQDKDGYINTAYSNLNKIKKMKERRGIEDLRFSNGNRFEFYIFGHYAEAAIAHYRTTGDKTLLNSAIKFADLIVDRFSKPNRLPYLPATNNHFRPYDHPNHELALVKLSRVTGNKRYLDFVRQTYEEYGYFGPKFEDVWGHAVQQVLLNSGAVDLYLETGAKDLEEVSNRLWKDSHLKKKFIIGSTGSKPESYGAPYYLPHEKGYNETCTGVSSVPWHHKMLLVHGDVLYADEMERSFYNNVLGGISLDGLEYFYPQPLRCDPEHGGHYRKKGIPGKGLRNRYLDCSCCPPNVHRIIASMGDYLYTKNKEGIRLDLYASSTLNYKLGEQEATLIQETNYPWEGVVSITVKGVKNAKSSISLRIPEWCEKAALTVNGKSTVTPKQGTYAVLDRKWNDGDVIELNLEMKARLINPNPNVKAQEGRTAIMYGPLVYCVEEVDNPSVDLRKVTIDKNTNPQASFNKSLLGGVITLNVPAKEWTAEGKSKNVEIKSIPYYAWANRKIGYMNVWLATDSKIAIEPKV